MTFGVYRHLFFLLMDTDTDETVDRSWKPPKKDFKTEIKIEHCEICGWFVRCPKCGNNSCNASIGLDGQCDVCPTMYDIMCAVGGDKAGSVELSEMVEKILLTRYDNGGSDGKAGKVKKKQG